MPESRHRWINKKKPGVTSMSFTPRDTGVRVVPSLRRCQCLFEPINGKTSTQIRFFRNFLRFYPWHAVSSARRFQCGMTIATWCREKARSVYNACRWALCCRANHRPENEADAAGNNGNYLVQHMYISGKHVSWLCCADENPWCGHWSVAYFRPIVGRLTRYRFKT